MKWSKAKNLFAKLHCAAKKGYLAHLKKETVNVKGPILDLK